LNDRDKLREEEEEEDESSLPIIDWLEEQLESDPYIDELPLLPLPLNARMSRGGHGWEDTTNGGRSVPLPLLLLLILLWSDSRRAERLLCIAITAAAAGAAAATTTATDTSCCCWWWCSFEK